MMICIKALLFFLTIIVSVVYTTEGQSKDKPFFKPDIAEYVAPEPKFCAMSLETNLGKGKLCDTVFFRENIGKKDKHAYIKSNQLYGSMVYADPSPTSSIQHKIVIHKDLIIWDTSSCVELQFQSVFQMAVWWGFPHTMLVFCTEEYSKLPTKNENQNIQKELAKKCIIVHLARSMNHCYTDNETIDDYLIQFSPYSSARNHGANRIELGEYFSCASPSALLNVVKYFSEMLKYRVLPKMHPPAKLFKFKDTYNKNGTKILANCLATTQFTRFLCGLSYYNSQYTAELSHIITLPVFGKILKFVGKVMPQFLKNFKNLVFDSITLTKASAINICNTENPFQSCTCKAEITICTLEDDVHVGFDNSIDLEEIHLVDQELTHFVKKKI